MNVVTEATEKLDSEKSAHDFIKEYFNDTKEVVKAINSATSLIIYKMMVLKHSCFEELIEQVETISTAFKRNSVIFKALATWLRRYEQLNNVTQE